MSMSKEKTRIEPAIFDHVFPIPATYLEDIKDGLGHMLTYVSNPKLIPDKKYRFRMIPIVDSNIRKEEYFKFLGEENAILLGPEGLIQIRMFLNSGWEPPPVDLCMLSFGDEDECVGVYIVSRQMQMVDNFPFKKEGNLSVTTRAKGFLCVTVAHILES